MSTGSHIYYGPMRLICTYMVLEHTEMPHMGIQHPHVKLHVKIYEISHVKLQMFFY